MDFLLARLGCKERADQSKLGPALTLIPVSYQACPIRIESPYGLCPIRIASPFGFNMGKTLFG